MFFAVKTFLYKKFGHGCILYMGKYSKHDFTLKPWYHNFVTTQFSQQLEDKNKHFHRDYYFDN